jgi:hypothetical protein
MKKMFYAAVAATALISSAAFAAVSFDSSTGNGFVGKGDIQVLYGWNNQQLQRNASGVTFSYDATDTYDVECYWETVTGRGTIIVHDINVPRHTRVNASIAYDARSNSKGKDGPITGFNLTGFGSTTTEGTVPTVGGTCPGASEVATIIAVTLTSSTGGLSVSYGGVSYPLPNTPVL